MFQERLLSLRVLYFGKGELIWECREDTRCQCNNPPKTSRWQSHPKLRHAEQVTSLPISTYGIAWLWDMYVGQYSKLSLSRQSDLLPALRGLATQLKQWHTGRYLAGLWEDTLSRDLCWFNQDSENLLDRPETWRAPTWS